MSKMVVSRAFARGPSKLWRPKCEGLQVHIVEAPVEENSIRGGENSRDATSESEQLVCVVSKGSRVHYAGIMI